MSHYVRENGTYVYTDYDGESLRFRQEESEGEKYLTIAYSGQGPVIPSGIDSVARMALAMLERSSGFYSDQMTLAVSQLRQAIYIHEMGREFKLNEEVEVFDEILDRNRWIRGTVTEYADGGYSVITRGSGVSMFYREENVRKVSK